jgi:hypothetical protein
MKAVSDPIPVGIGSRGPAAWLTVSLAPGGPVSQPCHTAGEQVTGDAEGLIDLGVVKREELCP